MKKLVMAVIAVSLLLLPGTGAFAADMGTIMKVLKSAKQSVGDTLLEVDEGSRKIARVHGP
jgi:hypothetical protein